MAMVCRARAAGGQGVRRRKLAEVASEKWEKWKKGKKWPGEGWSEEE